jgi:hypothetical protein
MEPIQPPATIEGFLTLILSGVATLVAAFVAMKIREGVAYLSEAGKQRIGLARMQRLKVAAYAVGDQLMPLAQKFKEATSDGTLPVGKRLELDLAWRSAIARVMGSTVDELVREFGDEVLRGIQVQVVEAIKPIT